MRREDPVGRYAMLLWQHRAEGRLRSGDVLRLGRELSRAIWQEQEEDAGYLAETDHRVRWCREVLQRLLAKEKDLRTDAPLEAVAAMLMGVAEEAAGLERVGD